MDKMLQTTREVHDALLPVLTEMYGGQLRVRRAWNTEAGLVKYSFRYADYDCQISTEVLTEKAGAICFQARVGRCYAGYRRALHWLACNRAGNSVALAAGESETNRRELVVVSHRVTLPGDSEGVREMLQDCQTELDRVGVGCIWFPQMLDGALLAELEQQASGKEGEVIATILAAPRVFLEWVRENRREALERFGELVVRVQGWLGQWDEHLTTMAEHYGSFTSEEQALHRQGYLRRRMIALFQTGKYTEALQEAREAERLNANSFVLGKMRALCGLGQFEEALEEGRSAVNDGIPRVWYWRSFAEASLGNHQQAVEHAIQYENMIGCDIAARRAIRKLLPDNCHLAT